MAVNVRRCNRRVTDPFNEKVRARIFSSSSSTSSSTTSSSGSEHEVVSSLSSSTSTTPCLSHLVHSFLENDSPSNTTNTDDPFRDSSDSESDESLQSDPTAVIHNIVNPIVWNNADSFRNQLLSHVIKATDIFSIFRNADKSIFNRNLMAYLREIGYNAGVCKTKWDSSAGGTLTAGNYEFIDVISPNSPVRYVIDADFAGEFEIARETENYKVLRNSLPKVFVGKVEDLKKIIRLMCDEARRSMKINGLTLPPWRRNRYMQIKWLGSYRRTTNHFAAATAVSSTAASNLAVKCRSVGFDIPCNGGRFLFPPVTRTR